MDNNRSVLRAQERPPRDDTFIDSLGDTIQHKQKLLTGKDVTVSAPPSSSSSISDEAFVQGAPVPAKAKSLNQLLTFTTVENLLTQGQTINLNDESSVEEVLQAFKDSELQFAPVYNAHGDFVRILNISDIFFYFCGIQQDDLRTFFTQKVKHLWANDNLKQTSPLVPLGTSLAEVIKTLSTGQHYVGVADKFSNTLFTIVSQLLVVHFIAKNISIIPTDLRNLPVQQFMKQIVQVKTIPSDTSTRESFEYLFMDNISAAAVVNRISGSIMDTISTTDLVGVVYDRFKYLERPVVDFLNATRRTKTVKPPITCRTEDTLEYVIMKLASTGVHRLWVVDSATQLQYLGLVNLTNVLEAIAQMLDD